MNIGHDYFHDKFNVFSSQNGQIKVFKGQNKNQNQIPTAQFTDNPVYL